MSRLATCSDGTRLVRCGDRVQICTAGLVCGSVSTHYTCPSNDDVPPTEIVGTHAGHRWSFEAWNSRTVVTADQLPFPDLTYTGTYTTERTYNARVVGVFGVSVQWGRPPTLPEVYADAGLSGYAAGNVQLGDPRPIGGAFGVFYLGYDVLNGTASGLDALLAPADADAGSGRLGVAWRMPGEQAACSWTVTDDVAQGRRRRLGDWIEGDAFAAYVRSGRETYDLLGDEFTPDGLEDGGLLTADYNEQAAVVQRVGGPVELPDAWEGPADGLVCPDDGGGGIDPEPGGGGSGNAAAIEAAAGVDPLRRPGCCG